MKSFVPLVRREWRLLLFGFLMTFGSSYGQTFFIALFTNLASLYVSVNADNEVDFGRRMGIGINPGRIHKNVFFIFFS